MSAIAFVNGTWSDLSSASVSIEDRGFQFGDGVYEVIRTYGKEVFGLKKHLSRLALSAGEIEIHPPYTPEELEAFVLLGCLKGGFKDTHIYIQLTRGSAPRNHAFPDRGRATLVMTFRATQPISKKVHHEGVSIISTEDIRWKRCHVKSLNLLPNVMARESAHRAGAFEAIFIRDGNVTEGAGSNLFAVFGDSVVTPPAGPYILSGITREIVLNIGRKKGLKMREQALPLKTLYSADELFLTGTTVEVLPVTRLNGTSIAQAQPGHITQTLYDGFQEYVRTR